MGFQQGLSGLNSSAKALDVIGNNIANSNTVGYKTGQAQFADVFASSLSGSGAAPVGLGSKIGAVVQQFTQGNVTSTNNPLDVAINGGGFFQMDDGQGGTLYARNGQFQLNKDGFIVNAQGNQLKGVMADANGVLQTGSPPTPLRLFDPTKSLSGKPQVTGYDAAGSGKGVQVNANLDAREAVPTVPFDPAATAPVPESFNKSTATTIYDSLGNPHTYSLYFVKTDPAVAPAPGNQANAWSVYATVTNPAGTTPAVSALGLQQTMVYSTTGSIKYVYDGAGTMTYDVGAIPPIGTYPMENITATELGNAAGVTDMKFKVDFTGSTQYGSTFAVNALLQDGYSSGTLAGFNIGTDGTVQGRYTNGRSEAVGQVILASFRNPQGLQPLGNNVWAVTPQSGDAITGIPGSSGQYGPLQSAAVEDANVDLTAELVNMITQQRVYQANAQTIKTQDQVLQTLVNLR